MSHNMGLLFNIVQTYHILSPWGIRKGQNPLCCYILATTVLAYMIFSWWKGFRWLVNLEAALQSIGWTRRTSQECNCCPRGCFGGPPQELEMWQTACEERCSPKSIPFLISSGEAWHLSLNLLTMCLVLNCYEISIVLWSFITVWITRVIWWHQWWPQWPREGWRRAARQHACSRTFSKLYFQAFLLLYFSSNYHLYFFRNICNISWRGCFKMTKLALMNCFSFPCNILKSPNILNWQVFFSRFLVVLTI